jgi:hypothetical protein
MFWKRKCNHNWELTDEHLIEMGMNKLFIYQCQLCNKKKYVTLDNHRWWKKHNKDGSLIN